MPFSNLFPSLTVCLGLAVVSIQVPSQTTTIVCLLCMGPLLTTRYIDAIERVQRRAARFVTNKYRNTSSVGNMLQHLEWRSLSDRVIPT
jgi:hypothetical protein